MGRKTASCNGVEATFSSSEEHLDRPELPGLVSMLAGRREFQLAGGLEDCQRSIGKRPAPCFLVLYHGRGRHSDRPWATKHLAAAWSTATRRCKFTRRLARLIAVIGDLPATSAFSYHLSSAHAPGPRLLPRRVRRGGTDHEARRAFGTLQRALEHAARISSGPMIRVNGDEPPDTACTRVLNAIT